MTSLTKKLRHGFIQSFGRLMGYFKLPKTTDSPIKNELLAIFAFSSSMLILLALWSFNAQDATLLPGNEFDNWLGPVGAFISLKLLRAFGIFSVLFPLALALISWQLFFSNRLTIVWSKVFGALFIICGIMPLMLSIKSVLIKDSFLVSGQFGFTIRYFLNLYFSLTGLWLLSLTIICGGTSLVLGRPYLKTLFTAVIQWFSSLKNKTQVKNIKPVAQSLSILAPIDEVQKKTRAVKILAPKEIPSPIAFVEEIKLQSDIQIIERDQTVNLSALRKAHNEQSQKELAFTLPPLNLLDYDAPKAVALDPQVLKKEADKLQRAFLQFGIEGKIREIRPGPVVTNYEFVPAPGIKLSRIAALSDDIAMAMSAVQVRIVTPIPGKGAVGIEVPNDARETVYLKEIVADARYNKTNHKLCMAIGKDVEGNPYFMNLADMPHVLIAGTTGSGKSVSVNAMICSILYRATPHDVRFLMIDPKMLELSIYNGIPHLLLPPIIDAKKAANALRWAVKEMDQRYGMMKEAAVRDITTYNEQIKNTGSELKEVDGRKHEHLPYIVIVVDEYADLLAVAGKEVEGYIMRLAQKARAAGIHVMLATQRPSVDVITGVIKANFPVRMGFRLASAHDSKTIINKNGAEKLLGKGDVLIMPPGTSDVFRIHGAFVSEKELSRVVEFLAAQKTPEYREEIAHFEDNDETVKNLEFGDEDEKFGEALGIVREHNKCSTSFLQRHLSVGYNRAARIVDQMEKKGLVGPVLNARGDRDIFLDSGKT